MKINKEISEELKSISAPLAAKLSDQNPYYIPEQYFDNLPLTILKKVVGNMSGKENIPMGYFDDFSANILSRIKVEEQAEEADLNSMLPENNGVNVYQAPENYFQLFPAQILEKINALEENEAELIDTVYLEKIGRRNIFTLPAGYFDTLAEKVQAQIPVATVAAPVVQMKKSPRVVRFLIAAAFTGLVGFSIFSMFQNSGADERDSQQVVMAQAKEILAKGNIDDVFNQLTAEDIEGYLNKSGHDLTAALAASRVEDKNLPDAMDYMFDEATLDNFLQSNKVLNN